jgi:hypothetical protein
MGMSAAGEARAKEDAFASGAKPRPEGPVRERGRRPTWSGDMLAEYFTEAARRRAIACARYSAVQATDCVNEGA